MPLVALLLDHELKKCISVVSCLTEDLEHRTTMLALYFPEFFCTKHIQLTQSLFSVCGVLVSIGSHVSYLTLLCGFQLNLVWTVL
jgi:hypothetical protein